MKTGEVLRSVRKERGLSLRAVEAGAGVTYSNLCRIEHGSKEMTISTLRKLCEFYDISAEYVLYPEGRHVP